MKVIGLTGNFGSGKSTVAKMFKDLGAEVIDADIVARSIVEPTMPVWNEIVEYFGVEVLKEDQTLDREKIANIVFNNEEKRQKLNSITHPRIVEEIHRFIDKCKSKKIEVVIVEASLIVEKGGMKDLLDKLIVVSVDEAIQLERVIQRDKISKDEALSRIKSQMPISEKISHADIIIYNSSSLDETRKQVQKIWGNLTQNE